jgi:hypothetical protein
VAKCALEEEEEEEEGEAKWDDDAGAGAGTAPVEAGFWLWFWLAVSAPAPALTPAEGPLAAAAASLTTGDALAVLEEGRWECLFLVIRPPRVCEKGWASLSLPVLPVLALALAPGPLPLPLPPPIPLPLPTRFANVLGVESALDGLSLSPLVARRGVARLRARSSKSPDDTAAVATVATVATDAAARVTLVMVGESAVLDMISSWS